MFWLRMVMALGFVTMGCGSDPDPFCGDGNLDEGEECDDGNMDETDFCFSTCKARKLSSLTVKWLFNQDESLGFSGDACIDLNARKVEVILTNKSSGTEPLILQESCSFKQAVFVDIPKGTYNLSLRVLDKNGSALNQSFEEEFVFDGDIATEEFVLPADGWKQSYKGTFFFRISWAGLDCGTASPRPLKQRLSLMVDGALFGGSTTTGVKLDGSLASACVPLSESFPQSVLDVPFGPASLLVEGIDSKGDVVYETEFETFVGAGVNNPELVFEVEKSN